MTYDLVLLVVLSSTGHFHRIRSIDSGDLSSNPDEDKILSFNFYILPRIHVTSL